MKCNSCSVIVDLRYINSSVAMPLSKMDCRASLAMTDFDTRHCEERSDAAIHLTWGPRLVYNDMAFPHSFCELRRTSERMTTYVTGAFGGL
jgi:hypothetical protein